MRKIIIIISMVLLFIGQIRICSAQSPLINNIELQCHGNIILIEYKIINFDSSSHYPIQVYFTDNTEQIIIHPKTLWGDVGDSIKGGGTKIIYWDYYADYGEMTTSIKPKVLIRSSALNFINGGPSNAILSTIIPGLGNYFVKSYKDSYYKPWMKTLTVSSLLGLGIHAANKRYTELYYMPPSMKGKWVTEYIDGKPYKYLKYFEVPAHYNEGGKHYHLFHGDAEILISTALAIWFFDIIWVYHKGKTNQQFQARRKAGYVNLQFKFSPNSVGLVWNL